MGAEHLQRTFITIRKELLCNSATSVLEDKLEVINSKLVTQIPSLISHCSLYSVLLCVMEIANFPAWARPKSVILFVLPYICCYFVFMSGLFIV